MMNYDELVKLSAECIRGEHGTAARLAAGSGYVYSGVFGVALGYVGSAVLGSAFPAMRGFADAVDAEIEDQDRRQVMDLLTLPLRK